MQVSGSDPLAFYLFYVETCLLKFFPQEYTDSLGSVFAWIRVLKGFTVRQMFGIKSLLDSLGEGSIGSWLSLSRFFVGGFGGFGFLLFLDLF